MKNNSIKPIIILHPFLLSVFPILYLFSANIGQVTPAQTYRSLAVTLGLAGTLWLLSWLVFRDWHRSALLVSVFLVLFFSFGHLNIFLVKSLPAYPWLVRKRTLFMVYAVVGLLLTWSIGLRLRSPAVLTPILNAVSFFLLAANLIGVIHYYSVHLNALKGAFDIHPAVMVRTPAGSLPSAGYPDIYYIILDGYGQPAMLQDLYGFDDNALINAFKQKGFYIAEDSHSNYVQTILSLASSLNMNYLDQVLTLDPKSNDRSPVTALIQNNAVSHFLKTKGYRLVTFSTNYEFTEISNSDVYIAPRYNINAFETQLLTTTLSKVVMDQVSAALFRADLLQRFNAFGAVADLPGPKFVFAHMVTPHPPFVFDANGLAVEPKMLNFSDATHLNLAPEDYMRKYTDQATYVNRLIEQTVNTILKRSKTPPIIIIQGDHGPGSYLDWYDMQDTCIYERTSILNMYYLPPIKGEDSNQGLYANITPVNTFRIILNRYFHAQQQLLPDDTYFSLWNSPFSFIDVTNQLGSCAPLGR